MKPQSLQDLWVDELRDLYNAENQIVKALPKLARSADSDELSTAFEAHLEQTREHIERLEQIFDELEKSPKGKKCAGMEGLLDEGKEFLEEDPEGAVLDAGLIGGAQKVEHYEIAAYGTAIAHANILAKSRAAELLEQTLQEEKDTDERLTQLASRINPETEGEEEESEYAGASGRSSRRGTSRSR